MDAPLRCGKLYAADLPSLRSLAERESGGAKVEKSPPSTFSSFWASGVMSGSCQKSDSTHLAFCPVWSSLAFFLSGAKILIGRACVAETS